MLLFLVILALTATSRVRGTLENTSEKLSQRFYATIPSISSLNLADSWAVLSQFGSEHSIQGEIELKGANAETIPVLHHMLNLYRLSSNPRQREELIRLMIRCLDIGVDASAPFRSDPPILFKTILTKEMNLTKRIISSNPQTVIQMVHSHNTNPRWASLFFSTLYSLPSTETVPLAKLLLHANTIIAESKDSIMGVDGVQKLLAGAALGKSSVKAVDLQLHSSRFNEIIFTMSGQQHQRPSEVDTGTGTGTTKVKGLEFLYLMDVMQSLEEVAGSVHELILEASMGTLINTPSAGIGGIADTTRSTTSSTTPSSVSVSHTGNPTSSTGAGTSSSPFSSNIALFATLTAETPDPFTFFPTEGGVAEADVHSGSASAASQFLIPSDQEDNPWNQYREFYESLYLQIAVDRKGVYQKGRNSLHFLCMSGGAAVLLDQIISHLVDLQKLVEGASMSAQVGLQDTSNGNVQDRMRKLAQLQTIERQSLSMMRKALMHKDERGHTPISYAMLRFSSSPPRPHAAARSINAARSTEVAEEGSHQAPILQSLQVLCDLLSIDFRHPVHESYRRRLDLAMVAAPTNAKTGSVRTKEEEGEEEEEEEEQEGGGGRGGGGGGGGGGVRMQGGWWAADNEEITKKVPPGECDLLTVYYDAQNPLPSNEEFFAKYVNTGTPVVFRRAAGINTRVDEEDVSTNCHMQQLLRAFRRDPFVSKYGAFSVPASTIPYAGSFGKQTFITTLGHVANITTAAATAGETGTADSAAVDSLNATEIPLYTFCTPSQEWRAQLMADVAEPRPIRRGRRDQRRRGINRIQEEEEEEDSGVGEIDTNTHSWSYELQFYLGPSGSGAPIHFHGHAINSLAYGEKEWRLYPPAHAFYSTTPSVEFFLHAGAGTGTGTGPSATANTSSSTSSRSRPIPSSPPPPPLRCTQQAGDVLYVPALWGHATLNRKQSVGVAHEFSVESFCME